MFQDYLRTFRNFNPNVIRYLLAISLMGLTVDGGIYSVVLNIFLLRLGYGPEVIGQITSIGLIAFALSSFPSGTIGMRWGNRRAMLVGLVIMMAANLTLPLVDLLPESWWMGWLLVTVILSNAGVALYFVNTAPYLIAATEPAQRNHAVSTQSAMIAVAAFIGSAFGGLLPGLFANALGTTLADATPYRYTMLIAALTINLGIFVLLGAADEDHPPSQLTPRPRRLYASMLRVPRIRLSHFRYLTQGFVGLMLMISCIRILQVTGMAVTMTFFNVYLDSALGTPTAQIGFVTGFARLVAVPVVLLMPLLSARWGNQRMAFWGSLATVLFMLPLALVPTVGAAGLGYMGIMASGSIRYTTFMVFSMELVKPEQRSILSGLSEMTAGLSFAVMSLLGGYLIVHYGYQTLFLVGAAGSFLGTLAYVAYFGLGGKKAEQPLTVKA